MGCSFLYLRLILTVLIHPHTQIKDRFYQDSFFIFDSQIAHMVLIDKTLLHPMHLFILINTMSLITPFYKININFAFHHIVPV
ncbi:hypothetical protein BRE01_62530 [Brevibacillus reuszeri]|uniref:Uncharacterized protein n=1 Tax=Brevibacillus reuszeri TaxID=54915 RepID=A0ABQ0TXK6_9BACL|nr:hypothetical protein BRE01_62530 [Brevibacillus reuszeri]